MAAWRLKGCPRCRGDLLIEQEPDGLYECCLMCGYRRDVPVMVYANKSTANTGKSAKKKA